jgi:hypothetical protein
MNFVITLTGKLVAENQNGLTLKLSEGMITFLVFARLKSEGGMGQSGRTVSLHSSAGSTAKKNRNLIG